MPRILIIGSTGAGKTRLALDLGRHLNHTVHHLDLYFHGQKYSSKSLLSWKNFTIKIALQESWIMDGNYFDTFENRIHRSTHFIWLDPPWILSAPRSLARTLRNRGKTRPDLGMLENTSLTYVRKLLTYKRRRHKDFVKAYSMAERYGINCARIRGSTSVDELDTFITPDM